jgi:hypothetical protein
MSPDVAAPRKFWTLALLCCIATGMEHCQGGCWLWKSISGWFLMYFGSRNSNLKELDSPEDSEEWLVRYEAIKNDDMLTGKVDPTRPVTMTLAARGVMIILCSKAGHCCYGFQKHRYMKKAFVLGPFIPTSLSSHYSFLSSPGLGLFPFSSSFFPIQSLITTSFNSFLSSLS